MDMDDPRNETPKANPFGTFLESQQRAAAARSDGMAPLIEQATRNPQLAAQLAAYEVVRQYLDLPFADVPPAVTYATGGNLGA
jgi:hypothetical protein